MKRKRRKRKKRERKKKERKKKERKDRGATEKTRSRRKEKERGKERDRRGTEREREEEEAIIYDEYPYPPCRELKKEEQNEKNGREEQSQEVTEQKENTKRKRGRPKKTEDKDLYQDVFLFLRRWLADARPDAFHVQLTDNHGNVAGMVQQLNSETPWDPFERAKRPFSHFVYEDRKRRKRE